MEPSQTPNSKAKLTEVNSYLTCFLCKGYYIDATTIVECLHSFCRSCIIQHLQNNSYCPICELMINTAKPNIKPDKTLQDIVYKLVPGLYASEMSRRRTFWLDHPKEAQKVACPEARGQMTERIIFSPQDAISLSIEYTSDDQADWNRSGVRTQTLVGSAGESGPDPEVPLRRYLQCPAMLRVEHLKKFICNKYNVDSQIYHVDILYKRVPLPDHYTLMDIAYIYSWKRNEPMKFFFRITDITLVSERFDYFEPSKSTTMEPPQQPTPVRCQRAIKQHNNNNNNEKKVSPIKQSQSENIIDNKKPVLDNKKICDISKVKTEIKVEISDKDCATKTKDNKSVVNANQNGISEIKNDNEKVKVNNVKSEVTVKKEDVKDLIETSEKSKDKVKEVVSSKESSSKLQVLNHESKVPNTETSKPKSPKLDKIPPVQFSTPKLADLISPNSETPKIKVPTLAPLSPEEVLEKSQFFMSIQLTAKNTSPPAPVQKPTMPEIIRPKIVAQKRKYVRKTDKAPVPAKKLKLPDSTMKSKLPDTLSKFKLTDVVNKMRKIAPKDQNTVESDPRLKIQNIKDPIVRLMVSNMNKQATSLNKLVGQPDLTNITDANCTSDRLQSLIDSCKLNIPSSLSITLTESLRNEDGTIAESKPALIKPVQNYIEILKLPDTTEKSGNSNENSDAKRTDDQKNSELNKNLTSAALAAAAKNQKHTFQTMFEEAIKRNESMKAQLFNIQKNAENAKKTSNGTKVCPTKTGKKQQSNALDLSSKTSPRSESTSPNPSCHNLNIPNPNSHNLSMPIINGTNGKSPSPAHSPILSKSPINTPKAPSLPNSTTHNHTHHKRNILEIAHQLSKRSRLDSDGPTLKIPTSPISPPKVSPIPKSPKSKDSDSTSPKQIIINSNFSSGGSISIKDSPKKTSTPIPKMPIPRLPISKVPTPKLTPPNIKNGNLLKFNNYTAKLAMNSAPSPLKSPPTITPKSPNSTKSESEQNTVQGLSQNQFLEKYNITNLAQLNANLNQAQLAFQQALMVSHQLEMHRMQQNNQKHWLNNPNILAHYESYVQSLKNQQNQICGNGSKN